jgi:cellobiose phosphorylase
MVLKRMTARFQSPDPFKVLQEAYPSEKIADAALFDLNGNIFVGFAGLKKPAPILALLEEGESFNAFVEANSEGNAIFLFFKDKAFKNGKEIPLTSDVLKVLRKAFRLSKSFGGVLNPDGSHTIDLLSSEVGPHYGVNLLLGWREGFKEPLLTTPKSVVDSFGRGSFRAKAAYQVLATRWDVRPEENGNPFNRQFYLLERWKTDLLFCGCQSQRFGGLLHSLSQQNLHRLRFERWTSHRTDDFRFARLRKKAFPMRREIQSVRLVSATERHLQIVFTGTFGFSNPGCQEVDVIYQTVIHQSEVFRREE